jgi:hypothetical protein
LTRRVDLRSNTNIATNRHGEWSGFRAIRLKNVKEIGDKKLSFQSGVLDIACAYAQGLSGAFSDNEIRKVIEDGL